MNAMTKGAMKTAAKVAMAKAVTVGAKKIKQFAIATDAALVKAGRAAQLRQRKRATKAVLRTAGKVALIAGGAAATVVAVRAVARNVRRGSTVE